MYKVLGFMGSPRRKGNTHVMVSKILEGARDIGSQTEIIFLDELNIQECDGCHACWKGKPCTKEDGMGDVYSKIAESDVLVFGTPVYWYGPTALMKGLIDRFVYFNCPENRDKIKNKKAILAIPFEEEDPATARLLVEFFEKSLRYLEMEVVATVLAPGVTKLGEVKKKREYIDACYEAGKRLVKA
jgi:multimeric flavodoxin WrbA